MVGSWCSNALLFDLDNFYFLNICFIITECNLEILEPSTTICWHFSLVLLDETPRCGLNCSVSFSWENFLSFDQSMACCVNEILWGSFFFLIIRDDNCLFGGTGLANITWTSQRHLKEVEVAFWGMFPSTCSSTFTCTCCWTCCCF